MATFTLKATPFPDGTTVGIYDATGYLEFPHSGPPGTAVTTATAQARTVAATGLQDATPYFAAAQVSGEWRYVRFETATASEPEAWESAFAERFEGDTLKASALPAAALTGTRPESFGGTGNGEADDHAAFQQAIEVAQTVGGGVILTPGKTYLLDRSEHAALNIARTSALTIFGQGATVKLSANTPRFLDFAKQADHDTFQNIEVRDLTVDADNVGGRHHVVMGTYQNGTTQSRINLKDITLRNVKAINVKTSSETGTDHRLNVYLIVSRSAAGTETDGPRNVIERISCEDVSLEGGNQGFVVGGTGIATTGLEVFWDEVNFLRCRSDLGVAPTSSYASVNFQIGSKGYGRRCSMRDCFGANSADEGVEINCATYVDLHNVVIEDAFNNHFYFRHYNTLETPGLQRITARDCHARTININTGSGFHVVAPGVTGASPHGIITFEDCSYFRAREEPGGTGNAILTEAASEFKAIQVIRFNTKIEKLKYASAESATWILEQYASALSGAAVSRRDCRTEVSGERTGSGTLTLKSVAVTSASLRFNDDNGRLKMEVTGMATHSMLGYDLGGTANTLTLSGYIRGFKPKITGDAGPYAVLVRNAERLIPGPFAVEGCDFSEMLAENDVVFEDATNRGLVPIRNNRWRTYPPGNATLASANEITPPIGLGMVKITGTTEIKKITATKPEDTLTLRFAEAVKVVDGENLKLNGNFEATADDTLSLRCDGTNWYEVGRSAN